jgi:predicted nucleic acid-binding protein
MTVGTVDLVVDAGVAIKWYIPKVHEADAKRLLDPAYTLHVPELFFVEFGNIVWKKARLLKVPEITVDEGRDILRLLLGVDLNVHAMAPLTELAYDLAAGAQGMTVHDGSYLVLAQRLGARLITADRGFHNALKRSPHGAHLLWVSDPL